MCTRRKRYCRLGSNWLTRQIYSRGDGGVSSRVRDALAFNSPVVVSNVHKKKSSERFLTFLQYISHSNHYIPFKSLIKPRQKDECLKPGMASAADCRSYHRPVVLFALFCSPEKKPGVRLKAVQDDDKNSRQKSMKCLEACLVLRRVEYLILLCDHWIRVIHVVTAPMRTLEMRQRRPG